MLAPSQMKLDTVREPTTKSHSVVNGNSLGRSCGLKVPSGSQTQSRSVSTSASPRRIPAPYPWRVSTISRADVVAPSSDVPSAALLLITRMSSTTPSLSKALMVSAMLSFSLYVGSTTEIVLPFHMAAPRRGDDQHLTGQGFHRRTEVPGHQERERRALAVHRQRQESR